MLRGCVRAGLLAAAGLLLFLTEQPGTWWSHGMHEMDSVWLGDSPALYEQTWFYGLSAGGDKEAISALITLVGEAPMTLAYQAEETLYRVAGVARALLAP